MGYLIFTERKLERKNMKPLAIIYLACFSSSITAQIMDVEGSLRLLNHGYPIIEIFDSSDNRVEWQLSRSSNAEYWLGTLHGSLHFGGQGPGASSLTTAANGYVGVLTRNPQTPLQVNGNGEILRLRGGTHSFLSLYDTQGRQGWMGFGNSNNHLTIRNESNGFSDLIILHGGAGGKFWMYPDGKLYANNIGNIGNHKDLQWNSSTGEIGYDNSSQRYKINIQTLTDDWSKILKTRPVKYSRPQNPNHWEYGYVAEEMDSIGLTNLVGYDAEGIPDDVKYDRMVLYLTEIVKMQQKQIRYQRCRLDAQENEILNVKEKLQELLGINNAHKFR